MDDSLLSLTKREREIFKLIVTGMSDSQIAENLCVSTRTINAHVTNIFAKLKIHDRKKLIYDYANQKIGNLTDGKPVE